MPADAVRPRVLLDGEEVPFDASGAAAPSPAPDRRGTGSRRESGSARESETVREAPVTASTRAEAVRASLPDGGGPTLRAPLGTIVGARSGDKGGNANLGVWTGTAERFAWLSEHLTVGRLRELLPETAGLVVERFDLPNLLALNFVVHGLLGRGVASSPRLDAQAKALGEELRAAVTDIPRALL
ncbi:AtuA-related protein [Planomonospora algeriensis]